MVFVQEQQVPPELERDELDAVADHVVLLEGGAAIATGRLVVSGDTGKLGRIAVVAERRGQGLGRIVMQHLEDRGAERGLAQLKLASQIDAVPFYERLGYEAYGEPFWEAGILHRWMSKRMSKGMSKGTSQP